MRTPALCKTQSFCTFTNMLLTIGLQDILLLIPILGCIQGYIFCLIIFFNKKLDWHKSLFLIAHIFSVSSLLLLPFIEQQFGWQHSWIADSLIWIGAPCTYFYIHMFSHPEAFRRDLLHLVVLTIAAYALEYWFFEYKADIQVIDGQQELMHSNIHLAITIGKFIVFFGYFFAANNLYNKHQHFIRDNFSNTRHYNLHWVRIILVSNMILIGYALLAFILSYIIEGFTIGKSNLTAYFLLIVYIYYASIKGLMQRDISLPTASPANEPATEIPAPTVAIPTATTETQETVATTEPAEKAKYQRNRLGDADAKRIVDNAIAAIENEELYLEPELTLQQLADAIRETPYRVSQALNQSAGKSFYELVNTYRVARAKELLTDERKQHLTVLSIAFEAGFNSKTTFNNVFKKFTGNTPSEYMKQHRVAETV
jgi:AraC-like DNA-binding protein